MRIQRREVSGRRWVVEVDEADRVLGAAADLAALLDGRADTERSLLARLNSAEARVLAPVAPSKIVAIGLNYRRHAVEMGKALPSEPLMFMKPPSAVIGIADAIVLPRSSELVHHEGELAVVIGRRARHVSADRAADVILGYTIMNDVTARDIQRREKRYTRAKGFDTFAPLGPTIVTRLEPDELALTVTVNDAVRQQSGCDDLIFKVPELVAFVSAVMTLLPGDVISTGTPSGVGPLVAGDRVAVSIEGIGRLENPVTASA